MKLEKKILSILPAIMINVDEENRKKYRQLKIARVCKNNINITRLEQYNLGISITV